MGTRFVLLAIAALFLGGLIFFGNRLSAGFRDRFLGIFPLGQNAKPTATPTPIPFGTLITTSPQPEDSSTVKEQYPPDKNVAGAAQTKGGQIIQPSAAPEQIPSTGPAEILWLTLGASFISGYFLRKKAVNR